MFSTTPIPTTVDWDPRSPEVCADPIAAYDEMRRYQPLAYSELLGWTLFRYDDVMYALKNPQLFSSIVSRHVAVPGGMDAPQHGPYRKLIDRYFTPEVIAKFEEPCRQKIREIFYNLPLGEEVEFTQEITLPYAVTVQAAFLGWPDSLQPKIARWIQQNQRATFTQDRPKLKALAEEFTNLIGDLMAAHEDMNAQADITAELMHETVNGQALKHKEIASILRTWTAGEIGTISASAGIVTHYLAQHPELRETLQDQPQKIDYAVDEILRLHGPLIISRRRTTQEIHLHGRVIPANSRVSLNWVSANRDDSQFPEPEKFRFDRDLSHSLLYGYGMHVCPGAPLARLELRLFVEELFRRSKNWSLAPQKSAQPATYPAGGFSSLPLIFE